MAQASANVIAGCFALAAFSVAILAGLAAGNASVTVLKGAVIAMLVCYPVGLFAGVICQHVMNNHVQGEKSEELVASDSTSGALTARAQTEEHESEILSV